MVVPLVTIAANVRLVRRGKAWKPLRGFIETFINTVMEVVVALLAVVFFRSRSSCCLGAVGRISHAINKHSFGSHQCRFGSRGNSLKNFAAVLCLATANMASAATIPSNTPHPGDIANVPNGHGHRLVLAASIGTLFALTRWGLPHSTSPPPSTRNGTTKYTYQLLDSM